MSRMRPHGRNTWERRIFVRINRGHAFKVQTMGCRKFSHPKIRASYYITHLCYHHYLQYILYMGKWQYLAVF